MEGRITAVAVPRSGVTFGNQYFLDGIRETLRLHLEATEKRLAHLEQMSVNEGTYVERAFDYFAAQKNTQLQVSVTRLTWILVVLTILLLALTGVLAVESHTVKLWLGLSDSQTQPGGQRERAQGIQYGARHGPGHAL